MGGEKTNSYNVILSPDLKKKVLTLAVVHVIKFLFTWFFLKREGVGY